MASLTKNSVIGGASRRPRRAGNVSGLASSRAREAGSCHRDESRKLPTKTKIRVATWNVGTLPKRSGEFVETLTRRKIDICGVQEHRWKGGLANNQAKFLKGKDSKYKFYYSAHESGLGGAGILLAECWEDKVFEVQRISDRIILLKLIVGDAVLTFISVYAPQTNRPESEKVHFYDQLQRVVAKVPSSEILIPVGDWNGHVGAAAGVYSEAHGGYGYGTQNMDGERVLEFAIANELRVGNTWFKKRDSHLVTYSSGGNSTQLDYILYRKSFSSAVHNVKVIPNEEVVQQHHLVVCDFAVRTPRVKKHKFVPRIRTWKLKDSATASQFHDIFKKKVAAASVVDTASTNSNNVDTPAGLVESAWSKLKGPLLEAATEVCGFTKKHQWRPETWWWNERVEEAVNEKRARYKIYNTLKKQGKTAETNAAKATYNAAKRVAKHVVWLAKSEAEKEEFATVSPNGDGVFRIAKQMDRSNQDIVGENCVRNDAGELALTDEAKMKAWVEHYARLLNVEFEWPSSELPEVPPTAGPPPSVPAALVKKAISQMKHGKAAGPSGIVAEMLKAAGDEGVELTRQLSEAVFSDGNIPADWEESYILNLHKGKGEALDRGNYRGLKLTDQAMKLQERILDFYIRKMVNIDEMQFAYVPGKGTTDAIFVVRQMQEKYRAVNKPLYFAFVDLEKAFDRVPRSVLWWALRNLGVEEWAIRVIQGMYSNARSRVRVNSQYSEQFDVGVGVHQGSVLSPLLFILVLEALSREFRTGVPWELLYADDLVIIADSMEECIAKLKAWKSGMESKGLRVNLKKTKILVSGVGLDKLKPATKFPCAVCLKGVRENSIECSQCKHWVHKRCSGVKGRLVSDPDFVCQRCQGLARPIDGRPVTQVEVDGTNLDVEPTFCYLGDMLDAGGGCDSAIAARCCVAWGKFRRLLPILTSKHLSPKVRGKVYSACVRSAMLHGSETWGPNAADLQRLRRNDRSMIRWICGVKDRQEVPSDQLLRKLGICEITAVLRSRRLRWAGHVARAKSCINKVKDMEVSGCKGAGRPRKTWAMCVKDDVSKCDLSSIDMLDRDAWRNGVRQCQRAANPMAWDTDSTLI